ncbi:uncharacterized protein LOC142235981 [Haematobia irritans]|uniref:uncharacterized protein LOC142235981 n=1 Tax=Haematobia irritans TaxID=7368 RepID=UPI003F4F78AB
MILFGCDRTSLHIVERDVNNCLGKVVQWATLNSLVINPHKSKAIMFGGRGELDIFVGQDRVEFVEQHRCLGILLDARLSFEPHVNMVQRTVYSILRRIYSTNMCFPTWVKARLAKVILMPHILYGLEIVSGTFDYVKQRIRRIVNTIDHITEHVKSLLGMHFDSFINFKCLNFFYKVIRSGVPDLVRDMFSFSLSSRNTQIIIPRIINLAFEKSFVVRIARIWNPLPVDLRVFSHTNNAFRLKLLVYLTQN